MKKLKISLYVLHGLFMAYCFVGIFELLKYFFDRLLLFWIPLKELDWDLFGIITTVSLAAVVYVSILCIKNVKNLLILWINLLFSVVLLLSFFYAEYENDSMSGLIIVYAFFPYLLSVFGLIWFYLKNKFIYS